MKNLIIGIIIGMLIGGVAYAATRYFTLQDATGNVINSSNPLPVAVY